MGGSQRRAGQWDGFANVMGGLTEYAGQWEIWVNVNDSPCRTNSFDPVTHKVFAENIFQLRFGFSIKILVVLDFLLEFLTCV